MPAFVPESDSEDELPPAWEERATNDGYVYYVNHQNKTTQWSHPRTNKIKKVAGELPIGWVKQVEEKTGKIQFYDSENKRTTYTDPRLAFAVEQVPQNISDIRQRFDASSTALQVLHGRDLSGKTAVVTGGNSGIGFETVRSLVMHGCKVIIGSRNQSTSEQAIQKISFEKEAAGKRCKFQYLNLESLVATKTFAEGVKNEFKHIDYLVLNAAVFAIPHSVTEDGFEVIFQVCHLSHFYLTMLLEDSLDHTSRVVVVSSESHRQANLPPNSDLAEHHLCPSSQKYWSMMAYNNAKLCNVLFARELGKRWQNKGISVFSLHPGSLVSTNLTRNWWFYRLVFSLVRPFTKSLQQAASTTIYCATAPELTGLTGLYFNNCFMCESSKLSQNDNLSKNLWSVSENMIKSRMNGSDSK